MSALPNKKRNRAQIPLRLNVLFLFVFILFSFLILQLGVVQILNGEEARRRVNETENTTASIAVPRGLIYDRNGKLLLDNEPERSITYTPPKNGDSAEKRLDIAEKLAKLMMMDEDFESLQSMVRERDKKEYWYLFNTKEANDRLTDEEKKLSTSEQYRAILDHITAADYNVFDWNDPNVLNVVAIKKELDQGFELSPHTIKNENVTEEEYALVSENLNQLPGIDAKIDWNRVKMHGSTFSSFIGNITTSNEGIPKENQDYYLTMGYSRNDRVGTSGLEQYYENILTGTKEIIQYTTDNNGNILGTETVKQGKSGNDLILTVDIDFQKEIDDIVLEEFEQYVRSSPYENRYMTDALVVMLDPKTGDIISLTGAHYDRENDEFVDQAYRVIYDSHVPGSVVKGATMLSGYDSGVVSPGTILVDRPIKIAATPTKRSWRSMGRINDKTAIIQSSNVYMFEIAMKLSGAQYRENEPLRGFNSEGFQTMRNYFHQFGLGSRTGIDLPYEGTGYVGTNLQDGGLLLDFAIGQYDNYTTLQLAQYIATIANDGYRVSPRIVKEVRQANGNKDTLGPVVERFNPNTLNRLTMDDRYIKIIQDSFRRVATEGTGRGHWAQSPYNVAIKTGTAQNQFFDNGIQRETHNLTLVGYAPYDDPEMAFAIVVPRTGKGTNQTGIHHNIGKRIVNHFFERKAEQESDSSGLELDE